MWRLRNRLPEIIGGVAGLILAVTFLIVLPMMENYEKCGRVTLCPPETSE